MARFLLKRLRFTNASGLLLAGLAVVVVTVGFLARRSHRTSSAVFVVRMREAVEECTAQSHWSFEYDCLRGRMKTLINKKTLAVVMDGLEELFASPSARLKELGVFTCHPSAHMVGEIAMDQGMSFKSVTAACGRTCDFGCSHGAFAASLRRDTQLLSHVGTLCRESSIEPKTREMFSCGHIVGHGLVEFFGGDARRAVSYCDQMVPDARQACGDGVLMEALVGLPDRPKRIQLTTEHVLAVCETFPEPYRRQCTESVGTYAANIARDPEESRKVCDTVPPQTRRACVSSVASVVYFPLRNAPDRMRDYCMGFDAAYRLACLSGAIDPSVGEQDAFSYGNAMCAGLSESSLRSACFSFLGQKVEWALGKVKRDESCLMLAKEDRLSCLR